MKRKIVISLLAAAMAAGLYGCGSDSAASSADSAREIEQSEPDSEKPATESETEEDEAPKEDVSEKAKTAAAPTGIVFGSDEAEGYEGFEYLMEFRLTADTAESGDEVTYSVYIPESEYTVDFDSYVSSDQLGVDFSVDLDPVLESEDYTVDENLEYRVAFDWSSIPNAYYAVTVGDVQSIADDMAVCEAGYIYNPAYAEDEFLPRYRFYCMKKTHDGVTALMEVDISAEDTTDETPDLLAELESFYGFDIGWDASFAENQLAEFEAGGEYSEDTYNLGYMTFELPEGWEKDVDNSPYTYGSVFAPGGDSSNAPTALLIQREYVDMENVVSALLSDTELAESFIASQFAGEETIRDLKISNYGETFMGETLEMIAEFSQNGESGTLKIYMGQVDDYIYEIIYAANEASAEELKNGQDALDLLFKTAQFK